ncbi:MAG TPA: PHB depolymerase family esterase [Verrucomicrobiae bacterium]|nr:PHB depolymerase family esterase [Verrucomicrobiae bacterium]
MKRLAVAALLALLAAAQPAFADSSNTSRESIVVGGVTRTYVLHLPAGLKPGAPLIVAFHGHFGTGQSQERLTGLDALSDRYGFVVAYPDGVDRGWNDGRGGRDTADDLGFARTLIGALVTRFHLDPKRVYATGMSNGATFTHYLACNESNLVAAIAPVSGSMPTVDEPDCRPKRAVSVLEIAGTADPIMPYGGGEIQLLGHSRGQVLSVEATAAFWARNAGCSPAPVTTALAPIAPPDGTSVKRSLYGGCKNGSSVVTYAIVGAGHTWPGGPQYLPERLIGISSDQLKASNTIVEFFLAHPMR